MCHVNDSASSDMFSSIHYELECNFDLVGNVFTANFIFTEAEGTAFVSAGRAFTPAEWTNSISSVLALGIAESSALNLILMALQRSAS